jgi:hypothetical protein
VTFYVRQDDWDQARRRLQALREAAGGPLADGGDVDPPECKHCGDTVLWVRKDSWIHETTSLYRCVHPDVAYGHLAEPEGSPCRPGCRGSDRADVG